MTISRIVVIFGLLIALGGQGIRAQTDEEAGGLSLEWDGYLKPIAIGEHKDFGDLGVDARENFEHLGVRTKLRVDGRFQDQARMYANYLLVLNEVDQGERRVSEDGNLTDLRLIEAYVDLISENSSWRIGAQQKHWYQFNGFADPTDRFNPKDFAFASYMLEEGKLPETGIAWTWAYAADHNLVLTYVPVSGVHKFSPTLEGFYGFLGYENSTTPETDPSDSSYVDTANPKAGTTSSKYVMEVGGESGAFTYLFTYVDGINPRPDLAADGFLIDTDSNIDQAVNGRLQYNRYHSPGLDLTYAFTESTKGKFDLVYYDTADTAAAGDELKQNDWWEYLIGIEMYFVEARGDINIGQKIVPHAVNTDYKDLDDAVGRRIYFQNALLGQPRETTNVVTLKYVTRFGAEDSLELRFDTLLNWNKQGELMRYRVRTELAVYLAADDSLLFRIRPDYDKNREITTQRLWVELEQRF